MIVTKLSFLVVTIVFLLQTLPAYTQTDHIHKIPLRLSSGYVYYATLAFGTSNQNLELLVDTGSQNIAIFCDICVTNCVSEQEFKTVESNAYKKLTCGDVGELIDEPHAGSIASCLGQCLDAGNQHECKGQIDYGGGDMTSYIKYQVSHDAVSLPYQKGASFASTFGCIYDSRNFEQGIWGLSLISSDNLLDQIHKADKAQGKDPKKLFTICTNSTDAVLNIGGIDKTYHIGQGFTIGVNKSTPQWWRFNNQEIGAITINDHVIRDPTTSFGDFGIILDSGTDFIILPSAIVTEIRSFIDNKCGLSPNLCESVAPVQIFQAAYKLTDARSFFSSMPTINIKIGEKILQTPISNYFWKLSEHNWAFGVVRAQKFGFPMSILGAIWMNNFDIVFDRSTPSVTIYDIHQCSQSTQNLRSQQKVAGQYDPYELPITREQLNSYASLSKLKVKYQTKIRSMLKKK